MSRKLGLPNCPKCKGEGVYPGEPIRKERLGGGPPVEYPTVVRCGCLKPAPPADPSTSTSTTKPKKDAAERAAGEKE